ncbi:hypothetical protein PLEOSDRAFT_1090753 [Pleurotus ostreatus PC15]|uniref:Uncharacterized protein n=1 Tax=Pleurotus ostreatus (strain PC15) TaxID=1137138 RepID=A0A067N5P6_PLEO1|nr:hypothetical protein PLEOSDRAFT_1090753 [Pleurotus ostreatus PC15]
MMGKSQLTSCCRNLDETPARTRQVRINEGHRWHMRVATTEEWPLKHRNKSPIEMLSEQKPLAAIEVQVSR